jgi:hypothetical protein
MLQYKSNPTILQQRVNGAYNKSIKQFANGTELMLYGVADEGNNMRNISADMLIKDEYQDLDEASESVVDEVITHSEHKINISLGTPKYTDTHYELMWKASNQQYYHVQCAVCKHWFVLAYDMLIGGHKIQCPSCATVDDKRNLIPKGKWIALGDKKAPLIGFHLSQLYVPYITKENIENKLEIKAQQHADVTRYLKNEILGEFYSGIRQRPTLETLCNGFVAGMPYAEFIPVTTKVYMGIDWGGWSSVTDDKEQAFTVVTIGFWDNHGKLYVNKIEIIDDPDELKQVDQIAELMQKYHVFLAIADRGYGKIKNTELRKKFGPRILFCKYLQGSSTIMTKMHSEETILVNRDYSLEELYSSLMYGKTIIPRNLDTEWVIGHFLNHEIEIVEQNGQVFKHFTKVKGVGMRTDAVHSVNYLRLAALHADKNMGMSSGLNFNTPNRAPLPILFGPNGMVNNQNTQQMRNALIPKNRNLMGY